LPFALPPHHGRSGYHRHAAVEHAVDVVEDCFSLRAIRIFSGSKNSLQLRRERLAGGSLDAMTQCFGTLRVPPSASLS
jgi:hypothetical protein